MDHRRNSLLISAASSLMLGAALMPGGHGYAAAGAVDLPATVKQLSGAGWVGSTMTVDQAAREVPMPEGGLLGKPVAVANSADVDAFVRVAKLIEERGKPTKLSRKACETVFEPRPGSGECEVRGHVFDESGVKRSLTVHVDPTRGNLRVTLLHSAGSPLVFHMYSLTSDGTLKRALYRELGKPVESLDLSEALRVTEASGYQALIRFWAEREAGIRGSLNPAG